MTNNEAPLKNDKYAAMSLFLKRLAQGANPEDAAEEASLEYYSPYTMTQESAIAFKITFTDESNGSSVSTIFGVEE